MMKNTVYDRIVLIILSTLLFAAALALGIKTSASFERIMIVEDAAKKEVTLKEMKDMFDERQKIDVNSAIPEELMLIPGVGEVLAFNMAGYRDTHGNFFRAEDLLDVNGIGRKKLKRMKEYIRIE